MLQAADGNFSDPLDAQDGGDHYRERVDLVAIACTLLSI
jgi:hypothetical protein